MRRIALFLVLTLALSPLLTPVLIAAPSIAAKKEAKPIPSPKPAWPLLGFRGNDGVYAKVPKSKELIGAISAQKALQKSVASCQEFACGAVFVAAEMGCAWWEVNSSVRRYDFAAVAKVKVGSLVTYASGSKSRALKTIILISSEPIGQEVSIAGIKVICHRDSTDRPKFGNIYIPVTTES